MNSDMDVYCCLVIREVVKPWVSILKALPPMVRMRMSRRESKGRWEVFRG